MLCPLVLEGLLQSLRALSFTIGEQFDVVTVSIDPGETPALAAATKARYMRDYGRSEAAAGWHFLTGEEASIQRLDRLWVSVTPMMPARTSSSRRRAHGPHPAGEDRPILLRHRVLAARSAAGARRGGGQQIGSPVDQLLLFCYQYDPATGQYTLVVRRALRLASLATVLGLGGFMVVMFRRDHTHRSRD